MQAPLAYETDMLHLYKAGTSKLFYQARRNPGLVGRSEIADKASQSIDHIARIGKAYHIKEVTIGQYFYPKADGNGEITARSRPLEDGELVSMLLRDVE